MTNIELSITPSYMSDMRVAWRGQIIVFDNGRRIWSKKSKVNRLTEGSAYSDAAAMREDALRENGLSVTGTEVSR